MALLLLSVSVCIVCIYRLQRPSGLPSARQLPPPLQNVSWKCQVDGGAWVSFSSQVSTLIEENYQRFQDGGSPTVDFKRDDILYKADFNAMQQQRNDGRYTTKRAIQRHVVQAPQLELHSSSDELARQLKPPVPWSPMHNRTVAERVKLPNGDERDKVEQAFMQTLGRRNIKVVDVERVQNLSLWRQYASKRWDIISREGPTSVSRYERVWLFHGTNSDTADNIAQQGFNRNFAGKNATMYGKGVYFARDASYSSSTTYSTPDSGGVQHMFAARVVVGEYCRGQPDQKAPDVRVAATAVGSIRGNILFDSTVDNVSNPSIFVTYNDAQAYPDYLIQFRQ